MKVNIKIIINIGLGPYWAGVTEPKYMTVMIRLVLMDSFIHSLRQRIRATYQKVAKLLIHS